MGSGLEAGGGFPLSGLVGWPAASCQACRLGNRDFFLLPVKGLISDFFDFSSILVENVGFGASPARTSVASIPAVFLRFFVNVTFPEQHDCVWFFHDFSSK